MAHVTIKIKHIPQYMHKIVGCDDFTKEILKSCINNRLMGELFNQIREFDYEVWVPFHRSPEDLIKWDAILLVKKGDTDRLSLDTPWLPYGRTV